MSPGLGVWIAAASCVVLVLWIIGAWRRLKRLRHRARGAFEALAAVLAEQHRWAEASAMPLPDAGDPSRGHHWHQRLQASGWQATQMLRLAQDNPLDAAAMASLHQARMALRAVLAAGVAHVATAGQAQPLASPWPPESWIRLVHQEQPPATAFNEALAAYNAAVSQFPALLVAATMRYRKVPAFVPFEHV